MMKRSISLPVKPEEEKEKRLERSEEIEELCEEILCEERDHHNNHYDHKINLFIINGDDFDESDDDDDDEDEDDNNLSNVNQILDDNNCMRIENQPESQGENHQLIEKFEKYSRVIDKSGRRNVTLINIPKKSIRFFMDFVTTLIEQKWRYTLTIFIGSFIISWIIFTVLWYLIAYAHGDLDFDENGKRLGEGKQPCIIGASTWTAIFIHSVEAQTTIGFGEKYPSEECPEGIFLFVTQLIISIALEGAMVGVIYSKISRPVKYVAEYKFSKNAVICTRDDKLCFIFRVCDPKKHQIIDTKISAYVLMDTKTQEGEILFKRRHELKISNTTAPILFWPETICHVIDETSPLYSCIQNGKFIKNFEIFISLVGSSPSLDQITESKTSYLPCEIVWDHYFANIILYDWEKCNYFIDYANFNTIISSINN